MKPLELQQILAQNKDFGWATVLYLQTMSHNHMRALKWRFGVNVCCWFFDAINIVCLSISKNRLLPASKIFGYAHNCLLEWKAKELTEAVFFAKIPWKSIRSGVNLASYHIQSASLKKSRGKALRKPNLACFPPPCLKFFPQSTPLPSQFYLQKSFLKPYKNVSVCLHPLSYIYMTSRKP